MVPPWADFFSDDRYEAFLRAVGAHFRARGRTARVEGDEGYVAVSDDPDLPRDMELGLSNLAQLCNQVPPNEWAARIDGHFEAMRRAHRDRADAERYFEDFAAARDLIAVRIGSAEGMAPMRGMLVEREDLPGTVSYLVLDFPHTVQNVPPE